MNHLTQEDLILSYYDEAPADSHAHLTGCAECRAELGRLARVLDAIRPADVPEPADDYEAHVWTRLSWRLRGERRRNTRERWIKGLAAAAVIAVAFLAGFLINRRQSTATAPQIATGERPAVGTPVAGATEQQRDRILLVVLGDHFGQSERVLVELTNLDPGKTTDISTERDRAEELLASNRLYRRTALDRGEEGVATLLDELEPVLLQIAHAPAQISDDELRSMQKRVEAKGLVFKLRVVQADVRANARRPQAATQPTI
jgi:hypothetical protein